VIIPGTDVRIRGSIDRLDHDTANNRVRVSDYKTGAEPPKANEIVLGRGMELQRVLYALAARQLVPDNPRVIARLVFLGADQPKEFRLSDIDKAVVDTASYVTAARGLLLRGLALPGPDAHDDENDFRLALPAAAQATYYPIKRAAIGRAFGDFSRVWSAR
jgi:RecB family exonuclease